MTNMSYCRFENTERDLRDCLRAFGNMLAGHSTDGPESEREKQCAVRLAELCLEVLQVLEVEDEDCVDGVRTGALDFIEKFGSRST